MKIYFLVVVVIANVAIIECNKDGIPGGTSEIDVNDPTIEELLADHIYRIDTGDAGELQIVKKTKVTEQVVAGMLYQIYGVFNIGEQKDVDCHITIWTRAWLKDENEKVKIKLVCGETRYGTKGESSVW